MSTFTANANTVPTLDAILTAILGREGWPHITNRPSDRGGLTKGGITFDSYNRWRRQRGKAAINPTDFNATVTEDEARLMLTDAIAGEFMAVAVVDPKLFALLFDWATTSGPNAPVRSLQSALRTAYGGGGGIVVDGVYGTKTDEALRGVSEEVRAAMVAAIAKDRCGWYLRLALRDADVQAFRLAHPNTDLENVEGWLNRALEFVG